MLLILTLLDIAINNILVACSVSRLAFDLAVVITGLAAFIYTLPAIWEALKDK